jgi:hypothetical protein
MKEVLEYSLRLRNQSSEHAATGPYSFPVSSVDCVAAFIPRMQPSRKATVERGRAF